jgi:hypothetical protein
VAEPAGLFDLVSVVGHFDTAQLINDYLSDTLLVTTPDEACQWDAHISYPEGWPFQVTRIMPTNVFRLSLGRRLVITEPRTI